MNTQRNKTVVVSCLFLLILSAVGPQTAGAAAERSILPEGLTMEEVFKPGRGRSVGRVQRVQGESVIVHADILKGYEARRGMPVYKDDSIYTLENAKIRLRLRDRSILSLASETKLLLNQSVFDKQRKERSSFLGMAFGKARFLVVKLLDYKRSEFKVKTPTAVCGVRGSDFILEATETETIATALEDTELEVKSLAFPDEPPVILKEGESSRVAKGMRPTPPVKLPPAQLQQKQELFFDVAPMDDSDLGDDDDLRGKAGDDSGIDEVENLESQELGLEDLEAPSRRPVSLGKEEDKPLPVPDPPKIKETIMEETAAGELPGFPNSP